MLGRSLFKSVRNAPAPIFYNDYCIFNFLKEEKGLMKSYSCFPKYKPSNIKNYATYPRVMSSYGLSAEKPLVDERRKIKFGRGKQESKISDVILKGQHLSNEEIEQLKHEVMSIDGEINNTNFDAMFMELCNLNKNFSVGKSFFYHLHLNNKTNLASIGKFFKLCYLYKENCTNEDIELIKEIYSNLVSKYPLLDSRTCENAAFGLAITDIWEEGINLLKMASEMGTPSTNMYCVIIEAAFKNKNPKLGWKLIEEASNTGDRNLSWAYRSWLNLNENSAEAIETLLLHMENHNIQPVEEVATLVAQKYVETMGASKKASLTKISPRGICKSCERSLQHVEVGAEEFQKLSEAFLNKVLIGEDIFLKTKPEEFQSYLKMLKRIGKVDVVLDGLNIAYAAGVKRSPPKVCAKMLRDVVQHFVDKSYRVLVIGRKHMLKWPAFHMNYIKENALTFFVDDVSKDDPLVLHATISSGLGTILVSRDMMRGHKYLLKDPKLRRTFSKWQQKHQFYLLHIEPSGVVHFQEPLPYLQNVQRNDDGAWHVPVNTGVYPGLVPHLAAKVRTWLCLH